MNRTPQSNRNSTSPSHRRRTQQPRNDGEIYAIPSCDVYQGVYVTEGFEEAQGLGLIDSGLPTSDVLSQSAFVPVSTNTDQYWVANTPPDQGNLFATSYDTTFYSQSMPMPAPAQLYTLPTRSAFPTVADHETNYPIHGLPIASGATYDSIYPSSAMDPGISSHLMHPHSLAPQSSSLIPQQSSNTWYPDPEPHTVCLDESTRELDQTTPRASEFNKSTSRQRRSPVKRERQRSLAVSRSQSVSSAGSLPSQAPFVCNLCHKEYARKSTLRAHHRTHGEPREKEFICKLLLRNGEPCQAAFHRRTDLRRHGETSIHDDAKRYTCRYNCGVGANRKDTITRHMRDVCVRGPRYGRKDSGSGRASPISREASAGDSSDEEKLDFSSQPSFSRRGS